MFPSLIWNIQGAGKTIYLTFDDGPHETATTFVLDELNKYNAKATFFCIGKNVLTLSNIYNRILKEGHAVGNHTFNHLNGWKTDDETYINDIDNASQLIHSNLFRPPYGRIKRSQAKKIQLRKTKLKVPSNATTFTLYPSPFKIIMWDVLSGDFDIELSPEKCLANVLQNATNGSIIVFHDSTKAWERMSHALPKVLEHFSKQGFVFKQIAF